MKSTRPLYKKKRFVIPLIFLTLIVAVRIVLEPILHKELNKFLATFSPTIKLHIADLDLNIIRGAYHLEGVTGTMKANEKKFLGIKDIGVSVAWREIFKGKVLTDILVDQMDFTYSKELQSALAKMKKTDEPGKAREKVFPVSIERLDLKDSSVTFDDYKSLKEGEKFKLTNFDATATNLTPVKAFPLSFFNMKASVMDSADVKTTGHLNLLASPPKWDVDGELRNFELTAANQFLKKKVPLTFTQGKLDLYTEAISENGKVKGYVKPFLKNLDIVKSKEDFKGLKHFGIEMLTALGNLILRAPDVKSVATKIPFSFDGQVHVDTSEALGKAIEHGWDKKIAPGIENRYELE